MPRYKVAHLREQGQDMIIIPLESSFEWKSPDDQEGTIAELQTRAENAGMAGTVVPVWENHGRMKFIAPPPWHPFFGSLNMRAVMANINKELFW